MQAHPPSSIHTRVPTSGLMILACLKGLILAPCVSESGERAGIQALTFGFEEASGSSAVQVGERWLPQPQGWELTVGWHCLSGLQRARATPSASAGLGPVVSTPGRLWGTPG